MSKNNNKKNENIILCKLCNKKIRPFKKKFDWEKREYHLKCWKQEQDNFNSYNRYLEDQFYKNKIINFDD